VLMFCVLAQLVYIKTSGTILVFWYLTFCSNVSVIGVCHRIYNNVEQKSVKL